MPRVLFKQHLLNSCFQKEERASEMYFFFKLIQISMDCCLESFLEKKVFRVGKKPITSKYTLFLQKKKKKFKMVFTELNILSHTKFPKEGIFHDNCWL